MKEWINSYATYTAYRSMQDEICSVYGADVTVYQPVDIKAVGYESNNFKWAATQAWINFKPKHTVFKGLNWYPDNEDQLIYCKFYLSFPISYESYIVTNVTENTSPYGNVMLKIVKMIDIGKYKVLERHAFAVMVSTKELADIFIPRSIWCSGAIAKQNPFEPDTPETAPASALSFYPYQTGLPVTDTLTDEINGQGNVFTTHRTYTPGSLKVLLDGVSLGKKEFQERPQAPGAMSTEFALSVVPQIGQTLSANYFTYS